MPATSDTHNHCKWSPPPQVLPTNSHNKYCRQEVLRHNIKCCSRHKWSSHSFRLKNNQRFYRDNQRFSLVINNCCIARILSLILYIGFLRIIPTGRLPIVVSCYTFSLCDIPSPLNIYPCGIQATPLWGHCKCQISMGDCRRKPTRPCNKNSWKQKRVLPWHPNKWGAERQKELKQARTDDADKMLKMLQRIEEFLALNDDLSSQQNSTSDINQTASSEPETSQIQTTKTSAASTSAPLSDSQDNSFSRIPLPSLETFDGINL